MKYHFNTFIKYFIPLILMLALGWSQVGAGGNYLSSWCGTDHGLNPEEYSAKLHEYNEISQQEINYTREIDFIRVQFHIVRNDNGGGGLNEESLWPVLAQINEDYAPSGLYFYHPWEVNEIYSTEYYNCENDSELNMLRLTYDTPDVMDIFIVGSATSGDTPLCGISTFSWFGIQGIVITISCWDNATASHEIGHYFDLFHTHQTPSEYVDGSQCNNRGDGLCDTPADPDLSLPGMVTGACVYTGDVVDGHGQAYDDCQGYPPCETYGGPDTRNYMNYNLYSGCDDHFTNDQNEKIINTAYTNRASYLVNPDYPIFQLNGVSFQEISGDFDQVLNPGESISLTFNLEIPEYWLVGAEDVLIILQSENPSVSIDNEELFIGNLQPGEQFENPANSLNISFGSDAPLGSYEFTLWVISSNSMEFNFSLNLSLNQSGFPVYTAEIRSSPLVIDLDNDGDNEIIFGDKNGLIHILNADGTEYEDDTFPFDTGDDIWGSLASADLDNDSFLDFVVTSQSKHLYIFDKNGLKLDYDADIILIGNPVIGNLDSDEDLEIVFSGYSSGNKVFVINSDGTEVDSFNMDPEWDEKVKAGVALADFNGNGRDDIVVGTDSDNIYLIYDDGSIAPGFPFQTGDNVRSSPSVLNLLGERIILSGCNDNNFYAINEDGSLRFSVQTGNKVLSSPAFINNNGSLFIFFGSEDGKLYAVDQNGLAHWGYPFDISSNLNLDHTAIVSGSIVAADLNSDSDPEIIFTAQSGEIAVIHIDGTSYSYFPVKNEFSFASTPQIVNLDGDEDLEIISGSTSNFVGIDIKESGTNEGYWSTYQGNNQRTGYYETDFLDIKDMELPREFALHPAYPNPFNPVATIQYEIPTISEVELTIINLNGKIVEELSSGQKNPGFYQTKWNAERYSSGMYLLRLNATAKNGRNSFSKVQKLILIK